MRYFEDMTSTYGFNDGASEPEGSTCYRAVYQRAMNALLDLYGSEVRLLAWNRPGLHNGCMLVPVTRTFFATLSAAQATSGALAFDEWTGRTVAAFHDGAYAEALAHAQDMDLDDYVRIDVHIDEDSLTDALTAALDT